MKHIPFLLGALLLVGASACDDKTDEGAGGQQSLTNPVNLTSEVVAMDQTTASWNDGDRIGVYMVQSGTNRIVGNASNTEYKAAASGALAAVGEPAYFSSDYAAFDFFAYYPYQAQAKNYIVPIDLSDQSSPTATCLLYSSNASGIAEQDGAVKLSFSHKLAKIAFVIAPGSGLTVADLAGLTMTVEGLNSQADFNAMNGLISNRHTPATVAATVAADGKTAQFVTIPAADQRFKLHFTLRNQLTFDWETDKTFTFGEGKIQTLNVTIGNSAVEVTPGGIEDWTGIDTPPTTGDADPLKAYAVGDLYPDATAPVGIVFEIRDGGVHGKVISLSETTGQRWGTGNKNESTDGVTLARDLNDGAGITRQLIEKRSPASNFRTDYALYNWIYATINQSNIDGGWYLPAVNELKAVMIAASGLNYADISPNWTAAGSIMPRFAETAAARTAFNAKITAVSGGVGLGAVGATYFCSSEKDSANAWCVKFNTGAIDGTPKDQNFQRARLIMAF